MTSQVFVLGLACYTSCKQVIPNLCTTLEKQCLDSLLTASQRLCAISVVMLLLLISVHEISIHAVILNTVRERPCEILKNFLIRFL